MRAGVMFYYITYWLQWVFAGACHLRSESRRVDESSIRPKPPLYQSESQLVQSRRKCCAYPYINIYIICSSWACMCMRRHQWRIEFVCFVSICPQRKKDR